MRLSPCRRRVCLISSAVAVSLSLLVAGCGGGAAGIVAPATTSGNGPLDYARCMRANGVPGFPLPTAAGPASKRAIIAAQPRVGDARVQAAQTACLHVNGGSPG